MNLSVEVLGLIITILSAITAIISAILAHNSAKTAKKSYSAGLLSQIYETYHTDEMYRALQLVWQTYTKIWERHLNDPEEAKRRVSLGEYLPNEIANKFVKEYIDKKEDTPEWAAIHKVWTFWTFVVVLIEEQILNKKFVTAFTSPRILSFIAPYEEEFLRVRRYAKKPASTLRKFYSQNMKK